MNPTIEIFRAGRHTAHGGAVVEITSADLAKSAAAYNPIASEAPVVAGHPASIAYSTGDRPLISKQTSHP